MHCNNIHKDKYVLVSCADNEEIEGIIRFLSDKSVLYQHFSLEEYSESRSYEADNHKILIVGNNRAKAISVDDNLTKSPFSLVISFDRQFLDCPNLFNLGQKYLISPFANEDLEKHLQCMNESFNSIEYAGMLMESNIIGESNVLKKMHETIANIARYDTPTLLKGETGTGKELVARALHYQSLRCDRAFVPVNCGALTDELLIAELFGYEKGAFTDAKKSHAGYVQQANEGTLFLDEVDSLSLRAQSALLRFIQENEYRRLGGEQVLKANVRVICATNQNLMQCVSKGLFREDLYYRLDVLNIEIPPLRDRGNDVVILARHFLQQFANEHNEPLKYLHPRTLNWMKSYKWPGNVRELENYIYRTTILSQGQIITVPEVKGDPMPIYGDVSINIETQPVTFKEAKAVVVQRFEKSFLQDVMKETSGNISEAARKVGTERRVFGRLLKKHGIEREHYVVS